MTVATPAARRLLMAALTACTLASGSLSHLTLVNPPPRLMFTAATGIPSCFCCSTCSSAATRSDANVVGDPKSFENTWTARICAPGPTPVRGRTPAAAPLPAAMPATCVPWLHSSKPDGNGSKEHGTAAPAPICVSVPFGQSPTPSPVASVPLAKHASPTTLPAKNSCEPSTPVSRTATTVPVPSTPAACAWSAWTSGTLSWRVSFSRRSSCTATTMPRIASSARSASALASMAMYGTVRNPRVTRCAVPFSPWRTAACSVPMPWR